MSEWSGAAAGPRGCAGGASRVAVVDQVVAVPLAGLEMLSPTHTLELAELVSLTDPTCAKSPAGRPPIAAAGLPGSSDRVRPISSSCATLPPRPAAIERGHISSS